MTASDPSMWDEQPHQKCVSDGGQIPDMNCIVNMISRPSQPQEPAGGGGGGPRVVTITTREAATLIAQGSGITRLGCWVFFGQCLFCVSGCLS